MPTVPYVRQTWTDGVSALSAARMAVLESGIYEVSLAPAARVYHNANQSISDDTATILAFNSERFDQVAGAADTMHDNSTNNSRLTCRYAGVYLVTANVQWAFDADGYRLVRILLNGTTGLGSSIVQASAAAANSQNVSTLYALAVNDYVEVQVHHTAGSALNVLAAGNESPEFAMVRVG